MDEILIGEKKYVSSKQAAKMTGYAKDYVGQLCREGRVPARLVGRSWYVLESAIQDHRFGGDAVDTRPEQVAPAVSVTHTWESARYESSDAATDTLPSLNRLQKVEISPEAEKEKESEHDAIELSELHDSWKAWFDHVGDAPVPPVAVAEADEQTAAPEMVTEEPVVEEAGGILVDEEEVIVPLHFVAEKRPLREVLPILEKADQEEREEEDGTPVVSAGWQMDRRISSVIHASFAVVALVSVVFAVAGSGYFDSYFVSNSQASVFSGISVLNK